MTNLTVHFLGESQFIYDGQVVTGLQTKRMRSLLGYLLLHAGQQVSAASSALAALAATIGRPFTFELLNHASELDEDQLVQSLDELWQRRIIREQGVDAVDYAYDFSHDRIRDVAYAEISTIRHRFLHRAVAAALETIYAGRGDEWSAEIAHHHERSGNRMAAAHHYRQAGERSAQQFAQVDAIAYFSRALALSGEEDPAARFALLGLRERAHHMHASRESQESDLAAMMVLADRLEDEGRRSMVLLRRAQRAEGEGDYAAAVEFAAQAIDSARAIGNRRLEGEGVIRLGSVYWNLGDYQRSEQSYHQGLETTALLHLGALNLYYAPYPDARLAGHLRHLHLRTCCPGVGDPAVRGDDQRRGRLRSQRRGRLGRGSPHPGHARQHRGRGHRRRPGRGVDRRVPGPLPDLHDALSLGPCGDHGDRELDRRSADGSWR